MSLFFLILGYLICSTLGLFVLKLGVLDFKIYHFSDLLMLLFSKKFVIGFILYGLSFLIWIAMLAKKDLSFIYPVVIGLSYLFIMLVSILFLKEGFGAGKILGIIFIGVGVIIIAYYK